MDQPITRAAPARDESSRESSRDSRDSQPQRDWGRRISNHIAWALLIYTGLNIFVTMGALKTGEGSILPYFSLIVLVAAIIPACRWLEKRWEAQVGTGGSDGAGEAGMGDPALAGRFTRDALLVWLAALSLPLILTLLFRALLAAA